MKAIILAAGASKRLRPMTDNIPKCLIKIGRKSIIDYQIEALTNSGITNIFIVVGYLAEKIMKHLTLTYPDINFRFIYNPYYMRTNTIYSLWLASSEMNEDFVYLNADVLFDKKIIKNLVESPFRNCLAISHQKCSDEEVKVIIDTNNLVKDIGKDIDPKQSDGEFIGIAKFSKEFNIHFKNKVDYLVREGKVNAFFELALKELIHLSQLYVIDVNNLPYIEIDFFNDLEKAKRDIYPLIDNVEGT